ncbi:hypothetical protein SBRCBS47491_002122 [Sporothrix bragantina]|uniref:DUF1308 domain-containing protein n=1 Tax=Sporothrix bragantina TaxID=671064 RepID=A0ABP0B4B8_9PEZI
MESDYSIPKTTAPSAPHIVDDSPAGLMQRWTTLISEYEAFQEALRICVRQPYWPGVRPYISMLQTEARQSERLAERAAQGEADNEKWRGEYRLAVTTLAAKEGMWRMIKTCRGVMALERRFLVTQMAEDDDKRANAKSAPQNKGCSRSGHDGIFVNAVVDNGREWLRVLTTTNAQLMVELAENGWEWGEDDVDEDAASDSEAQREARELEDIMEMSLVKTAMSLIEAARTNRCKGAYPRICIVLTRMDEVADGEDDEARLQSVEIGRYLGKVRRGLAAYIAAQLPPDIDGKPLSVAIHSARAPRTVAQPPDNLEETLQRLLPELSDRFTPTVNIDTSILISLASDITHSIVPKEDWHPPQRRDEMAREAKKPGDVLKTLMNVALRGRRLVCTQEAASAFRIMVHDMAQPSEGRRGDCLLGDVKGENGETLDRMTLVQRYRELSNYPQHIPDDLMLPIEVVDTAWSLEQIERVSQSSSKSQSSSTSSSTSSSPPPSPCLPAVAYRVAQDMAIFNPTLAVFFYGWAAGQTTITTNLVARNRIARLLERYRTSSHEQGPLVWVCRTARSLNGTNPANGRRDGKDKIKIGGRVVAPTTAAVKNGKNRERREEN